MPKPSEVLVVNGGSSSVKFALYAAGETTPVRVLSGEIDRIGSRNATLTVSDRDGRAGDPEPIEAGTHQAAAEVLIGWCERDGRAGPLSGIGHRIVHGGPHYSDAARIDDDLVNELRRLTPFAPNHLPLEIELIESFRRHRPGIPQVACFDTAFHHGLPARARTLPVPLRYSAAGVRRYGFHGISYTYLTQELERLAGVSAAAGRVILAHLGNGSSLAAVRDRQCVDTSMGLTPNGGVVMGTRSGDLDPGIVTYLLRSERWSADEVDAVLTGKSGLLGLSEATSDMRDLIAREQDDERCHLAVEIFCYQIKKWIGAFAAALGGLDTLVFAGGIGEHAPVIRERICGELAFLGIEIDGRTNASNAAVISTAGSPVTVRIIPTNEELIIAKAVWEQGARERGVRSEEFHVR
jgi:acetate kinase